MCQLGTVCFVDSYDHNFMPKRGRPRRSSLQQIVRNIKSFVTKKFGFHLGHFLPGIISLNCALKTGMERWTQLIGMTERGRLQLIVRRMGLYSCLTVQWGILNPVILRVSRRIYCCV